MRTYTEAEVMRAMGLVKKDTKEELPNPYLSYQDRKMQELSEEIGMTKLLCKLIKNHKK